MNNSWITTLTNDKQLDLVVALYFSLEKVKSKFPLNLIVTNNVSKEALSILRKLGIHYKIFQYIKPTDGDEENFLNEFYIYDFKEFDKVCYLKKNFYITQNIDFIFKSKEFVTCKISDEEYDLSLYLVRPSDCTSAEIFNYFIGENLNSKNTVFKMLYPEANYFPKIEIFLYEYDKNIFKEKEVFSVNELKFFIYENSFVLYDQQLLYSYGREEISNWKNYYE